MKCIGLISALTVLADNIDDIQRDGSEGVPLTEILGDIPPVDKLIPWDQKTQKLLMKTKRSPDYYKKRTPDDCKFPLEILILQDLTASFTDNIDEMKNVQLKQMVNSLSQSHPGSRFGVVSFQDKPIMPYGGEQDACLTFRNDFTTNYEEVYNSYADAVAYGGYDARENQFAGIIQTLNSQKLSWSAVDSEYARLIVVVTDAGPHHADDKIEPYDHRNMSPWPSHVDDSMAEQLCLHTAYPSAQQVYDEIVKKEVYIASLVYDADWANGFAGRDWREFNRFIAQPDGFVERDAENSSLFWTKLSKIIEELERAECNEDSTTSTSTAPPVTTQGPPDTTTTASTTQTAPPVTTQTSTTSAPTSETKTAPPVTTQTSTTSAPSSETTTAPPVTTQGSPDTTTTTASTTQTAPPVTTQTSTTSAPTSETKTAPPVTTQTSTTSAPTSETKTAPPVTTQGSTDSTTKPSASTSKPTECHPTQITDECIPGPDNCNCQPEVLIQIRSRPDNLNLNVDNVPIIGH